MLFLAGALYAALQYNELHCLCGNKLRMTNPLSEESCEADCSNNQTFNCTSALHYNMKVFSTGLPGSIHVPYKTLITTLSFVSYLFTLVSLNLTLHFSYCIVCIEYSVYLYCLI